MTGPPERERAAPHHQSDPNQHPDSDRAPDTHRLAHRGAGTSHDVLCAASARRFASSRATCLLSSRSRGYAGAWREGFGYGFRDALRLVAREIDDPKVWAALADIADGYALAGCDE